ncbi:hypothetical protein GCM10018771_19430 [Streptomyces cellulosae]|nr:hypothetical protein GCM10018771_19430 [Streptomyces cellulosae]
MLRMSPAFRLWAGVLLACALTLCLSGIARPAMAVSGPMSQTQRANEPGPMAEDMDTAPVVADSPGMGGHCPATSDHRSRTAAAPAVGDQAVPASVGGPLGDAAVPRLWAARAGPPPAEPPAPPPDLHRICVLRT